MKQYTGFIEPTIIDKKEFILGQGNVPFKVVRPDGDWSKYLSSDELQSRSYLETYNCTGFNTLKQIQEYEKNAFNEDNNYSERWVGIIAGTKPPGNDPQTVYEAIRKYGLIFDSMLPFSDDIQTIEDYYSFKGADMDACYEAGRQWLSEKKFYHEWVWDPSQNIPTDEKINNMKVALKYSPLSLAVYAWATDERGIYVKLGLENHWTNQFSYKEFQEIFDSYDPTHKLLEQDIVYCKRIHIERNLLHQNSITSIGDAILNFFSCLLTNFKRYIKI